jgi:hypothetical protein
MLLTMAGLLAAVPLLATGDPASSPALDSKEQEQRRRRLERWRADKSKYAHLLNELRAFLSLSPERQKALRALDRDLYREAPSTQVRLFEVMERYADWLDRLPPSERKRIEEAVTPEERTKIIRGIHQRRWIERLPQADRKRLAAAQGPARAQLLAELRQKERERRKEWRQAQEHWAELTQRPVRLAEFIREYLLPRLTTEEKRRLPNFGQITQLKLEDLKAVVELAGKHPSALPGRFGPTQFEQLPTEVQQQLVQLKNLKTRKKQWLERFPALAQVKGRMDKATGHWPEFGIFIANYALHGDIHLPNELWPARFADLSPPVQLFLEFELRPVLEPGENKALKNSENRWPAFPVTIERLAKKHNLRVPWQTLPGPRKRWDVLRAEKDVITYRLPPLPRQTLRNFALVELSDQDRANLGISSFEEPNWERLKQEYFRRHMDEFERLRDADKKLAPKGKEDRPRQ